MSDELDIGLIVARRLKIIGNCLVFVHPQVFGVGAHKSLIEDAARQQIELLFFQGPQQAGTNLGGLGNFVEGNAAHLAFAAEPVAK
jgi:hypothetical protein